MTTAAKTALDDLKSITVEELAHPEPDDQDTLVWNDCLQRLKQIGEGG